ncbi:SAM-dependent methyltransferase [Halanaerobium hydrogeniformans]|uniref:Methyltransferase type 11 n=1 Tax=Halanaerobium hydrogeniformans TaxID=656519 RepID=E4RNZ4_HALHG|nr:cyclopropane-fatty-acyl-phospholipid synthase family protein [Halanaerobium hydrogeniformans]ADQ13684.1 Methyltransferase type 11 [Halanaerobium hydrogeniformans]
MNLDKILAEGWLPDFLLRYSIRKLLAHKIKNQQITDVEKRSTKLNEFIAELKEQPIAVQTDAANEQHYELPPAFFGKILGDNLKYSCCYWEDFKKSTLEDSELAMLELSTKRAEIENGQEIMDLGCGWGSLSFYIAENYPDCSVTAVSNSQLQIDYIQKKARARKLKNLRALKADINNFQPEREYDRVLSIEMFEHMRNYQLLFDKVSDFLKTDGKLFVHIFSHHTYPYLYEDRGSMSWMARHFFSGGTMPSQDLLHYFCGNLSLEKQWAVSGSHYQKTLLSWLQKMDEQKEEIRKIFEQTYGAEQAEKWWNFWRTFFISSAEFFGYNDGNEWFISHYLFKK